MFASQAKNITSQTQLQHKLEQSGIWLALAAINTWRRCCSPGTNCLEKRSKNHVRTCELKLNRKSGGRWDSAAATKARWRRGSRKAHLQTHTQHCIEKPLDRQMYPRVVGAVIRLFLVFANVERRREEINSQATKPRALSQLTQRDGTFCQAGAEGILIQLPAAHCLLEINSIRAAS